MAKVSFSDTIGILGMVLVVVTLVLDKVGLLKGSWLQFFLLLAGAMTLFIAIGNTWVMDAPAPAWRWWRGLFMFCIVGFIYSALAISVHQKEQRDSQAQPTYATGDPKATSESKEQPKEPKSTSLAETPLPHVSAPGGIAIGRDNLGAAIVNPPVNPNAPVTTYDFNGAKRVTSPGKSQVIVGNEFSEYQRMAALHDTGDKWEELKQAAEQSINTTPEWLTPYYLLGIALANLGQRDEAIKRLEYVVEKAGGNEQYKDAERILQQLKQPKN